jgi:hypothetical protein
MVFPARQMIFDVIGDLIADRRQREHRGRARAESSKHFPKERFFNE